VIDVQAGFSHADPCCVERGSEAMIRHISTGASTIAVEKTCLSGKQPAILGFSSMKAP